MMTCVPSRKVSIQRNDSLAARFAPAAALVRLRAGTVLLGAFLAAADFVVETATRIGPGPGDLAGPGFFAFGPIFLRVPGADFLPVGFAMTFSSKFGAVFTRPGGGVLI